MSIKMKTYNQSTERKLLHLMLISEDAIEQCLINNLSIDDFGIERHKMFFEKLIDIYLDDGVSLDNDLEVLTDRLEYEDEEDRKQSILALNKIFKLTINDGDVPVKLAPVYIKELKDLSVVRKIVRGVQGITKQLSDESCNVTDLLETVERMNNNLITQDRSIRRDMKDAIDETIRGIIEDTESDDRVKFYIKELDDVAKILKGYLTYIAAAPGMGKSAVLLNLAEKMSSNGVNVGYFSLEMNLEDCVKRIISMHEGINAHRLQNPKLLKPKDWKIIESMLEGGELPTFGINWLCEADLSIVRLKSEIEKMVRLNNIDVVMIDYYQLLSLTEDDNLPDSVRIPRVSDALKVLASKNYIDPYGKPKKISIIALSQVVKEVEYRENKRPTMNDLFFGGAKDARLVLSLYRDEYYNPDNTNFPNIMEFGVVKQNNGVMGQWIETFYDSNNFSIRELTEEEKLELDSNKSYNDEYEDEDDYYEAPKTKKSEKKSKKDRPKKSKKKNKEDESEVEDDE